MAAKLHLKRALALLSLFVAGACSGRVDNTKPSVGSETNWLGDCSRDGVCAEGECICGICTKECSSDADCDATTQCTSANGLVYQAACGDATSPPIGICVQACDDASDCSAGMQCVTGGCVPQTAQTQLESSSHTLILGDLEIASVDVPLCLPRPLPIDEDGLAECVIAEAFLDTACDCSAPGRRPASPALLDVTRTLLEQTLRCSGSGCDDYCVCEYLQAAYGDEHNACVTEMETSGWCYADPAAGTSSTSVVADCPQTSPRRLIMSSAVPDRLYAIGCVGSTPTPPVQSSTRAPLGSPCVPLLESSPQFGGFEVADVTVDVGTGDCASNLCMVNHFQGRVTCPYGNLGDTECSTPDGELVTADVYPELVARQPESAVYCSCRCDGPEGTGPFCECPADFECTELIPSVVPESNPIAGSYCVKSGTEVKDPITIALAECQPLECGPP